MLYASDVISPSLVILRLRDCSFSWNGTGEAIGQQPSSSWNEMAFE